MTGRDKAVRDHYDRFLASRYLWMAGGFSAGTGAARDFLAAHAIRPGGGAGAIDLGAGCGFFSVSLAEAGFRVTAVDFCAELREELRRRAPGSAGIGILAGDIMDFPLWAGRGPALIACTGDTLTHLSDIGAVNELIRQCHAELLAGGRLVLAFRDYTAVPPGEEAVIPVRRDADRIFLCRLAYGADSVQVTDIVYERQGEAWERLASTYRKLRLAPARVREILADAGFGIEFCGTEGGMVVMIGRKG